MLPKAKNTFNSYRSPDDEDDQEDVPVNSGVKFKLLSRDGKGTNYYFYFILLIDSTGRVEARELLVPEDNSMAIKLSKAEETLRLERQKLKERVLQIEKLNAENEVSNILTTT